MPSYTYIDMPFIGPHQLCTEIYSMENFSEILAARLFAVRLARVDHLEMGLMKYSTEEIKSSHLAAVRFVCFAFPAAASRSAIDLNFTLHWLHVLGMFVLSRHLLPGNSCHRK